MRIRKSPRSNRDVQCPTMETAKSRPRSLKNGACISIVPLRVVHRLRGHPVPSHQDSRHPQSFFSHSNQTSFQILKGIDLICFSPLLRDLFEAFSQRAIYRLYPAGSIKGLGLPDNIFGTFGFHIEKWRVRPQKHITWEFRRKTNSRMPRIPAHVGLLIMHSRVDRHAPGKTTLSFLPFSLIVVVHVVLPSV